jgi:uncharacterized cupin superfamily protein
MPKIDLDTVRCSTTSSYPAPYAALMAKRAYLMLGDAGGLTQFGANITILDPGGMSSLRHWHLTEDEFVMVTQGEVVLVEDTGETVMRPGDCAAFPAGVANGHHFMNRTGAEARFLVIGTRDPNEVCTYSDIDMKVTEKDGVGVFTRKDGSPLPKAD